MNGQRRKNAFNYPSVDPKYVDVPLVMVSQREKSYSNTPVDTIGHFLTQRASGYPWATLGQHACGYPWTFIGTVPALLYLFFRMRFQQSI